MQKINKDLCVKMGKTQSKINNKEEVIVNNNQATAGSIENNNIGIN